jgi:hypothetical protein
MRGVRGGRPSCLLVPSKVDRRTSLGRQASASLARLGWTVGPALAQRAAHAEAFKAAKWIGAHAPGSAAHLEVRMLVEQVEDRLMRCKEPAAQLAPGSVEANGHMAAAADPESAPGGAARIGAACLHLVGAVLAKLRRAEQQAYTNPAVF